ncbi:hypothetical protein FA13DRAFT_1711160 [Coprinellus micaceus]|uniref:Ndc10 domain-containing protein n=1 Tax=Coprinellus micaceus TaxID=71717 RepID=A0A4Y7T7L0_COPMI|nr:hypothetical protein FA13DRAFT_1711160 [Coprinellus micaceus]
MRRTGIRAELLPLELSPALSPTPAPQPSPAACQAGRLLVGELGPAESDLESASLGDLGVKAHGLWSSGSSFREAYYRALPVDAMLALTYFNGEHKDSYFILRVMLDPPTYLLQLLFPWVEAEQTAYELRRSKIGNTAKDKALTDFLDVLQWTWTVLLQDVAVLINKYGRENVAVAQFTPFNTPKFLSFAASAPEVIKMVESKAATWQQVLPQRLTEVFTGCVQSFQIVQQRQEKLIKRCNDKVDSLVDTLEYITMIPDKGKKRKAPGELKEGLKCSAPCCTIDNDPDLSGQGSPASTPPHTRLPTPTPSSSASSTAVASPTTSHLSLPSDCALDDPQAISGNGNIYSQQTFLLSSQPDTRALQIRAISELERVFEPLKLCHNTFEWVCSKGRWEWLPVFDEFWKPNGGSAPSVAELWKEFKEGHGFHFSIEELNVTWAAR